MIYNKLVLDLIKTLPKFDQVDDEGNNICHHIAKNGDDKIFNILKKNHFPNWSGILNQRNADGDTPLHLAIKNNKQTLVNKYIKLGANKNMVDINGNNCHKTQTGGSGKITGKRYL